MLVGTPSDRILETLRRSAHPLDNDQLAERAEIGSWHQVNLLCRSLERDGRIRRIVASDQRIVNAFVEPAFSGAALDPSEPAALGTLLGSLTVAAPPAPSCPAADPRRQLLDRLGEQLGVALSPATFTAASGAAVEVDGTDDARTVLVACWTAPGRPTHTVLADVLKLSWIAGSIEPRPRIVLVAADPVAAEPFRPESTSWAAHALRDMGVSVMVMR